MTVSWKYICECNGISFVHISNYIVGIYRITMTGRSLTDQSEYHVGALYTLYSLQLLESQLRHETRQNTYTTCIISLINTCNEYLISTTRLWASDSHCLTNKPFHSWVQFALWCNVSQQSFGQISLQRVERTVVLICSLQCLM